MAETKYWLAFNTIEGLGSVSILKISKHFKSMKEAWSASAADLHSVEGIYNSIIEKIVVNRPSINPDKLLEETYKQDIKVLCIADKNYPALLKEIYDPPVVLYYKGNYDCLNLNRCVGMVGTRRPTEYGREMAYKIASELVKAGITVVSGLAEGIDTCAHSACLEKFGTTIAVLGSGFNKVYPKSNRNLFEKIAEANNGVVFSEYHPDCNPDSWRFPYRNRIVSGLSRACIIVESRARGGSLITAKSALEQNREVYRVPSRVGDHNRGVLELINRGEARIFTSFTRFYEDLNWELKPPTEQQVITKDEIQEELKELTIEAEADIEDELFIKPEAIIKSEPIAQEYNLTLPANINKPEEVILTCLGIETLPFDSILQKTGLGAPELLGSLTMLELKGLIVQQAGKRYKRKI